MGSTNNRGKKEIMKTEQEEDAERKKERKKEKDRKRAGEIHEGRGREK